MSWRYRPEAELEVETIAWEYEQARPGLGVAFLGELERLYGQIDRFPRSGHEVLPGVRRAVVKRFPYLVYYVVLPDAFEILAVVHHARHERSWRDRAEE